MKPQRLSAVLALVAALGVAGCAPYASVSSVSPSYHPSSSTIAARAPVERGLSTALRQKKREPIEAIGGFLAVAQSAQQQLARNPANIAARDDYNFAVARVLGTIQQARLAPWTHPLSVDSLAPNDLVMLAIQKIPVRRGIPHHVICGDRGKGGHKGKTKPVMSDGVVPYWSSRMDTAESELVVPSGHGAHRNPKAIAEVGRILKLHAASF